MRMPLGTVAFVQLQFSTMCILADTPKAPKDQEARSFSKQKGLRALLQRVHITLTSGNQIFVAQLGATHFDNLDRQEAPLTIG